MHMTNREYSEEDKRDYIELAQEVGVGPAMRELGYPGSYHTAKKWFELYQLPMPTVSSLKQQASELGVYYTEREETAVIQLLMDRYTEALNNKDLTPDELNKIANGYQKAIQTKRLIEGKATNIGESHSKDGTDLEIARLTREMEERNEQYEKSMESDRESQNQ